MRRTFCLSILVASLATVTLFADNWPQWRGPELNGVSRETRPAGEVDARPRTSPGSCRCRAAAARRRSSGTTRSSSTSRTDARRARAVGVDRNTGAVLWKRPLGGGNNMQRKQNMSSPSPVTDGTAVWVMTGTGILKAFDFNGKELWTRDIQKDYGRVRPELGLRLVAAAARGRAVRAGAARHEDRRSVVPAAHRQEDRQDGVAGRAADRRASANRPTAYTTPALLKYGNDDGDRRSPAATS